MPDPLQPLAPERAALGAGSAQAPPVEGPLVEPTVALLPGRVQGLQTALGRCWAQQ